VARRGDIDHIGQIRITGLQGSDRHPGWADHASRPAASPTLLPGPTYRSTPPTTSPASPAPQRPAPQDPRI